MAINYDLVVLGMGSYAEQLVAAAVQREARVAWVCHQNGGATHLNISQIRQVFSILKHNLQKYPRQKRREIFYREIIPILNRFAQQELLENIQTDGVDVIFGEWQFPELSSSRSQGALLLEVSSSSKSNQSKSRQLESRAYAIANDYVGNSINNNIAASLCESSYLTVNQLLNLEDLPNSVTLIGDDFYTCEIAQAVNFLGVKTTLIANHSHILPSIDVAIARTLQAQLEIEGIEIHTQAKVTAVEAIANSRSKIWLDNQILECDRLLLPSNYQTWQFPTHPCIYACNNDIDVQKIIKQTLQTNFWRSPKIIDNKIICVETTPPIAQLGTMKILDLENLYILESYGKLGQCKVICDRQGHIIGASILGDHAKLVIEALDIAMQSKLKILDIDIEDLSLKAQWQNLQQSQRERSWLKDWFTFRRDWNI